MNLFRRLILRFKVKPETYASIVQDADDKKTLRQNKIALLSRRVLSPDTSLLEGLEMKTSPLQVQKIVRDTPTKVLAIALAGASGKVVLHFLNQFADRGQILMLDDIEDARTENLLKILKAQSELLEIVNNILNTGNRYDNA